MVLHWFGEKSLMSSFEQDIIFLGICDRANYNPKNDKWDIIGLGNFAFSYIFPTPLTGMVLGLNLSTQSITQQKLKFEITKESGTSVGKIDISGTEIRDPTQEDFSSQKFNPVVRTSSTGRTTLFIPLDIPEVTIIEPGIYNLKHITNQGDYNLGSLQFIFVKSPPLSAERIAAIKSDPCATKSVRIELGCKHCLSKYRSYASYRKRK